MSLEAARASLAEAFDVLHHARRLLPIDGFPRRLVVDTNALMDQPDLAVYVPALGSRYMVHVLPVGAS